MDHYSSSRLATRLKQDRINASVSICTHTPIQIGLFIQNEGKLISDAASFFLNAGFKAVQQGFGVVLSLRWVRRTEAAEFCSFWPLVTTTGRAQNKLSLSPWITLTSLTDLSASRLFWTRLPRYAKTCFLIKLEHLKISSDKDILTFDTAQSTGWWKTYSMENQLNKTKPLGINSADQAFFHGCDVDQSW